MQPPSRLSFPSLSRSAAIAFATAVSVLLSLVTGVACARATVSSGMFAAGQRWNGEFADPTLLRVGNTYYAYSTVNGGDNLPVEHSSDLATWFARNAYPANSNPGWWSGYNDALPHPAKWALYNISRNGRHFTSPWAPSVGFVGGHFVAAYSVPYLASKPGRRCISIATSAKPIGPFVDNSNGPIVCSSDPNGSIDPHILTLGDGSAYLLWKNAGVPGSQPTRLWSRRLNSAGTGFAAGSAGRVLLATAQGWENNVIENPAMTRYAGRFYLFYSANSYATSHYAIGYAICSSPLGPCRRPLSAPLLASRGAIAGPGAPSPVVGSNGALRLGYAAWDAGHAGYGTAGNYRRLHVAGLSVAVEGTLRVTSLG